MDNAQNNNNTNNNKNSGCLTVFIIIIILYLLGSCDGGIGGTSYYMDYNRNGQMDNGEHVYDEYDDGSVGLDFDGDGWNDSNYDPE